MTREPVDDAEVCVVAASSAWPFYQATGSYICQANRRFRDATRLGFYSARTIHPLVARIEHTVPQIDLDDEHAAALALSADPVERRVGKAMAAGLHEGMSGTVQVVVLSAPRDPATETIGAIRHEGRSAWTVFQRYVPLGRLRAAELTSDLADTDAGEADDGGH
ncbi:hypothetical protein [Nocardioides halotolerans]|uniref:hypothetical protein n=1 Tax=Nocardioides halotolerans TaxID=433660 RepID=UPI0012FB46C0|nr:hypothetical protein [Nocardioides halotolerans]